MGQPPEAKPLTMDDAMEVDLLTVPFGVAQGAGPLKACYMLENAFGRTVSNFVVTVP